MNRRALLQGSAAAAAGMVTGAVSGKEAPRILIVCFSRAGENYAPGGLKCSTWATTNGWRG